MWLFPATNKERPWQQLLHRLADKSSFWARSASERVPGPTTPDQKTKRTTLRKSSSYTTHSSERRTGSRPAFRELDCWWFRLRRRTSLWNCTTAVELRFLCQLLDCYNHLLGLFIISSWASRKTWACFRLFRRVCDKNIVCGRFTRRKYMQLDL